MCLMVFNWQPGSPMPLQVWANRDEFLARPTASSQFWAEAPDVFAGRDLLAGGTWMGVTRCGRFAALTNFRDPARLQGGRSRGGLVADFLTTQMSPADYVHGLEAELDDYAGFSLLVADTHEMMVLSTHAGAAQRLAPGWHGLSNAQIDTPWPKLQRLLRAAQALPLDADAQVNLSILVDTTPAHDADLPETGVGLMMERVLSPICIRTPAYGTRNSTWLRMSQDRVDWHEIEHASAAYQHVQIMLRTST